MNRWFGKTSNEKLTKDLKEKTIQISQFINAMRIFNKKIPPVPIEEIQFECDISQIDNPDPVQEDPTKPYKRAIVL